MGSPGQCPFCRASVPAGMQRCPNCTQVLPVRQVPHVQPRPPATAPRPVGGPHPPQSPQRPQQAPAAWAQQYPAPQAPVGRRAEAYSPSVPQPVFRLPDTPLVHLGIGAAIVVLFALSAIPSIIRQAHRVPTRIGDVFAQHEGQALRVIFTVLDERGTEMVAPGDVQVDLVESGLADFGLGLGATAGRPIAGFVVQASRDRFQHVQEQLTGERLLACVLKGIRYDSTPQLLQAHNTGGWVVAYVSLETEGGEILRGQSEPTPLASFADFLEMYGQ